MHLKSKKTQINKKNVRKWVHVDTNAHPLHPNISIHILLTVFYTFHLEADKENLFNNQENVELVIIFFILMILMNDSAALL